MAGSAELMYDAGIPIEDLFPDDSIQEHVMSSDMWAGSLNPIDSFEYVAKDTGNNINITQTSVTYAPALYKCFDEAVVNALDNMVRMYGHKGDNPVTHISVKFSREGRIIVENDGRGVPIGMHNKAKKWSVELIFGTMFKGRAKTDREKKVTGDANRVGIKIANIMSSEFIVETVHTDSITGKSTKYCQRWYNNMKECDAPTITENVKSRQYCKVSFMPEYEKIFKTSWSDEVYNNLNDLFRFRCITAASFAGFYTKNACTLSYQGKIVPVRNMRDIANIMFANPHNSTEDDEFKPPPILSTVLENKNAPSDSPDDKLPWEVCIVVTPNNAPSKKKLAQITNVNCVYVIKGGRHIEHLSDGIITGVKESIEAKLKIGDIKWQPSYVYNNIFILVNAQIPGVGWGGQRKDEALTDKKKVSGYQFNSAFIEKLTNFLKTSILESIYGKDKVTGMERKKKFKQDKYVPAQKAGSRESTKCRLLLPEGDSAASMISNGITEIDSRTKKPFLGFKYYGYMTLGGVIVNARKEINIKIVGDKKCINVGPKLPGNKFFSNFLDATGLNLNYQYDPDSSTYKKEMSELNYGGVIACVDQDHDGSGFIYPLLCNIFEVFWPHLLQSGFVCKWETPRLRAVPKKGGHIFEFHSDHDFKVWLDSSPNHNSTNYVVNYIKGLGGHENSFVTHMFREFHKNVVTYYPDDRTPKAFEIMFGKCSAVRKDWLRTPIVLPTVENIEEMKQHKRVSLTSLIHNEGKEHGLSNLQQKLWSAIDGMNESGRKILDGCIKVFTANGNKKLKVNILQGHIIAKEFYEHSETSLQESIVGKVLLCVGGVQLPQLLPRGNFGTRRLGGGLKDGDSASPRYISCVLNKKFTSLMYPPADYPNYAFKTPDGQRAEPQYFVPILPMAILESTHIPAHGWKLLTWARDVFSVLRAVRYMINSYDSETIDNIPMAELKVEQRGFKGEFRYIRGVQHCFGDYSFNPKTRVMKITELPLRTWTEKYTRKLIKENTPASPNVDKSVHRIWEIGPDRKKRIKHEIKMFSREPSNMSGKGNVNIEIQIAPPDKATGIDPVKIIEECGNGHDTDGFEEYFELHSHMHHNLSMISTDGSVIEFKTYEDVVRYWFPVRKSFYAKRLDRQRILLGLEIRMYENIIRYVGEYKSLRILEIDDSKAEGILNTRSYDRFNKGWLLARGYIGGNTDQYIPTEELEKRILDTENENGFDYLLNTTDRGKLTKANELRKKKLEEMKIKLNDLENKASKGKFYGAQIWLDELDELEAVITQGFKTEWEFENVGKYTF